MDPLSASASFVTLLLAVSRSRRVLERYLSRHSFVDREVLDLRQQVEELDLVLKALSQLDFWAQEDITATTEEPLRRVGSSLKQITGTIDDLTDAKSYRRIIRDLRFKEKSKALQEDLRDASLLLSQALQTFVVEETV